MSIIHTEHCLYCGSVIKSVRNGRIYCSSNCQSYMHRLKERYAPALTIADYRIHLIESIRKGGYHPYSKHPINKIKRQIDDLEYQISSLLPVVADP